MSRAKPTWYEQQQAELRKQETKKKQGAVPGASKVQVSLDFVSGILLTSMLTFASFPLLYRLPPDPSAFPFLRSTLVAQAACRGP